MLILITIVQCTFRPRSFYVIETNSFYLKVNITECFVLINLSFKVMDWKPRPDRVKTDFVVWLGTDCSLICSKQIIAQQRIICWVFSSWKNVRSTVIINLDNCRYCNGIPYINGRRWLNILKTLDKVYICCWNLS